MTGSVPSSRNWPAGFEAATAANNEPTFSSEIMLNAIARDASTPHTRDLSAPQGRRFQLLVRQP